MFLSTYLYLILSCALSNFSLSTDKSDGRLCLKIDRCGYKLFLFYYNYYMLLLLFLLLLLFVNVPETSLVTLVISKFELYSEFSQWAHDKKFHSDDVMANSIELDREFYMATKKN